LWGPLCGRTGRTCLNPPLPVDRLSFAVLYSHPYPLSPWPRLGPEPGRRTTFGAFGPKRVLLMRAVAMIAHKTLAFRRRTLQNGSRLTTVAQHGCASLAAPTESAPKKNFRKLQLHVGLHVDFVGSDKNDADPSIHSSIYLNQTAKSGLRSGYRL